MTWLRQLLDWQRETQDPGEFLDSLRFDLARHEVFVFTPKGDVIALPAGATPVDFAYAVHTEVGPPLHRRAGQRPAGAAGAHAGQRRRRRDLHLEGRDRRPVSRDWLGFVKSAAGPQQDPAVVRQGAPRGRDRGRARTRSPGDAQAGPAAAAAARRRRAASRSPRSCATPTSPRCTPRSARATCRRSPSCSGWCTRSAARRARSRTSPRPPIPDARRSRAAAGAATPAWSSRASATSGSSWRAAARRCPATTIVGFVTRGSGVSVHRADCTNVDSLLARSRSGMRRGRVGADRRLGVPGRHPGRGARPARGCSSDVTRVLSDEHVNILSAAVHDDPRPGGDPPVHLRDGRPEAPRPPAAARPQRRGRLRRLPGHLRLLAFGASGLCDREALR